MIGRREGRHGTGRPVIAPVLILVAIVAAMALPLGGLVRAAAPAWGAITAESTFGVGVEVRQVVDLPSTFRRVELLVAVEGDAFTFVEAVPPSGITGEGLEATFETPFGGLAPNTPLILRFRITAEDGTTSLGPAARLRYVDDRIDWRTAEGDLVRIHWTAGGAEFGRRALAIADRAVAEATALLGVDESEPIDFFVYADRDQFRDVIGPGARENVGGQARPDIRTLFAQISANAVDDPWVAVVIPHELMHVVFDSAVRNPYHRPPRWLNEGVAVYLAEGYGAVDRAAVREAIADDALMPLSALTGQFPTDPARFSLAYAESVSAVDHLVRTAGTAGLAALIRSYATGVTDDEAFTAALGMDVAGFEAAWLAGLGADRPSAHGPVAAPAGPVPSDWVGPPATPGTVGGPSAAPSADPSPGSPAPSPTAGPGPDDPDRTGSGVPMLVAIVLLVGTAIGGTLFLRRRATPRGER